MGSDAPTNPAETPVTFDSERARARFLDDLRAVVGDEHLLVSSDLRASYETDWTRRWTGSSIAVVRPANTQEVSALLATCQRHHVACVPQGGRTGLVGGSVPSGNQLVLTVERLNDLGAVDFDSGELTVGAGTTLGALQRALGRHGWEFGVDLASRDSATVGGMIATNAGGAHVVQHGQMREQVVALEVVLADGTVMGGASDVTKDNAGYDLSALMVGSEGTLGVITSARLRLVPHYRHRVLSLVGVDTLTTGLELLGHVRRSTHAVAAAEFFDHSAMQLVEQYLAMTRPVRPSPWYVLIECASEADLTEAMAAGLTGTPGVDDDAVAVALDSPGRQILWSFRESITEAIAQIGVAHKLDVGVAPRLLDQFAHEVRTAVHSSFAHSSVLLFGHLAEGNVHVNVINVPPTDATVDDLVLRLVGSMGGTIAAEHGVGRAKRDWLHLSRSPAELHVMRALKSALDPENLLNPDVLFA